MERDSERDRQSYPGHRSIGQELSMRDLINARGGLISRACPCGGGSEGQREHVALHGPL